MLVAQAFTVGDDDGDYTLTSIELPFKDREISSENIGKLTVSVWSVDTETSDDDPLVGMEPVAWSAKVWPYGAGHSTNRLRAHSGV